MVMLPAGVLQAVCESKSPSIKTKLFSGVVAQTRAVFAPVVLLTRAIFRLNNTPDPERGVKSFEKQKIRRVLIAPPPGRMLAIKFQFVAVRPAPDTGEL